MNSENRIEDKCSPIIIIYVYYLYIYYTYAMNNNSEEHGEFRINY